jgi:hypothetical protein
MRQIAVVCTIGALVVSTVACGKSEQQKQLEKSAEQAKQAADQMSKGAEGMAKGMEQMAKSVEAMASGGNPQNVEPVSFRELETVFPELPGWQKGKPTGEKMSSPVKYSEAKVTYTNGDSRIEAKLTDSAFNQLMTMGFSMVMAAGYEKETEDGYEKAIRAGRSAKTAAGTVSSVRSSTSGSSSTWKGPTWRTTNRCTNCCRPQT